MFSPSALALSKLAVEQDMPDVASNVIHWLRFQMNTAGIEDYNFNYAPQP